jgi:hypothetical protein
MRKTTFEVVQITSLRIAQEETWHEDSSNADDAAGGANIRMGAPVTWAQPVKLWAQVPTEERLASSLCVSKLLLMYLILFIFFDINDVTVTFIFTLLTINKNTHFTQNTFVLTNKLEITIVIIWYSIDDSV